MDERDFGWALKQLKAGKKVTRPSGKGYFLWVSLFQDSLGTHFEAKMGDDERVIPWPVIHSDLLATDWEVVDNV